MTYNPWAQLRELGPRFAFGIARLPAGRGWWCPDVPGIVLDKRLTRVERRSVLAHELVHVEEGDRQCASVGPDGSRQARRRERKADVTAARRLIDLDALAAAELWGRHPTEVAEELDVDLHTLRVRVETLDDDERAYLRGRLEQGWGAA